MEENTFNGWANRETWAANLWLENDEGLHSMASEAVKNKALSSAGEAIKDLLETLFTRAGYVAEFGGEWPAGLADAAADIGSLYRVDHDEIAAAWLESVEA